MSTLHLPTINACLNLTAGVFVFLGWRAIRNRKSAAHKQFMIAALAASLFFLICYLTYHLSGAGITRYQGQGIIRLVYFAILLTHTPLAVLIVPFALAAVYFALWGDFKQHVAITRWLLPAWLYVSITGVIIYLMLYVF